MLRRALLKARRANLFALPFLYVAIAALGIAIILYGGKR